MISWQSEYVDLTGPKVNSVMCFDFEQTTRIVVQLRIAYNQVQYKFSRNKMLFISVLLAVLTSLAESEKPCSLEDTICSLCSKRGLVLTNDFAQLKNDVEGKDIYAYIVNRRVFLYLSQVCILPADFRSEISCS